MPDPSGALTQEQFDADAGTAPPQVVDRQAFLQSLAAPPQSFMSSLSGFAPMNEPSLTDENNVAVQPSRLQQSQLAEQNYAAQTPGYTPETGNMGNFGFSDIPRNVASTLGAAIAPLGNAGEYALKGVPIDPIPFGSRLGIPATLGDLAKKIPGGEPAISAAGQTSGYVVGDILSLGALTPLFGAQATAQVTAIGQDYQAGKISGADAFKGLVLTLPQALPFLAHMAGPIGDLVRKNGGISAEFGGEKLPGIGPKLPGFEDAAGEQPKMAVPEQKPGGEVPLDQRPALTLESPIAKGGKKGMPGMFADLPPIAPEFQTKPGEVYINGDKARATGNTQELHGATFHEYTMLEGTRAGQTVVSRQAPLPPIGGGSGVEEYAVISPHKLDYDPRMQARAVAQGTTFDPRVVKQIVQNYDPSMMTPLDVAPTPGQPGRYTVLGGMHRGPALAELGVDATVRVHNLDLSDPAQFKRAQQIADKSNLTQRDVSLKGTINAINRAGTTDVGELRANYPRLNDQQIIDAQHISTLPGHVIDKLDALPASSPQIGIAAEVGRGAKVYTLTPDQAEGLLNRFTAGPRKAMPTRVEVRDAVDLFGPKMQESAQGGMFGAEVSNPIVDAMVEHARLAKEITKAKTQLQRDIMGAQRIGIGETSRAIVSAKQDLAALGARLDQLDRGVLGVPGRAIERPSASTSSTSLAGENPLTSATEGTPSRGPQTPPATVSTIGEPPSGSITRNNLPDASLRGAMSTENIPASVPPEAPPAVPSPAEPNVASYKKYRTPFGIEYKSEDAVWHGSNLREVRAHAVAQGASEISIVDHAASVQRPKHISIKLESPSEAPPASSPPAEPAVGGVAPAAPPADVAPSALQERLDRPAGENQNLPPAEPAAPPAEVPPSRQTVGAENITRSSDEIARDAQARGATSENAQALAQTMDAIDLRTEGPDALLTAGKTTQRIAQVASRIAGSIPGRVGKIVDQLANFGYHLTSDRSAILKGVVTDMVHAVETDFPTLQFIGKDASKIAEASSPEGYAYEFPEEFTGWNPQTTDLIQKAKAAGQGHFGMLQAVDPTTAQATGSYLTHIYEGEGTSPLTTPLERQRGEVGVAQSRQYPDWRVAVDNGMKMKKMPLGQLIETGLRRTDQGIDDALFRKSVLEKYGTNDPKLAKAQGMDAVRNSILTRPEEGPWYVPKEINNFIDQRYAPPSGPLASTRGISARFKGILVFPLDLAGVTQRLRELASANPVNLGAGIIHRVLSEPPAESLAQKTQYALDGLPQDNAGSVLSETGTGIMGKTGLGEKISNLNRAPWQALTYFRNLAHEGNLAMMDALGKDTSPHTAEGIANRQASAEAVRAFSGASKGAQRFGRDALEKSGLLSQQNTRALFAQMGVASNLLRPGANSAQRLLAAQAIASTSFAVWGVGSLLNMKFGNGDPLKLPVTFDPKAKTFKYNPDWDMLKIGGMSTPMLPQASLANAISKSFAIIAQTTAHPKQNPLNAGGDIARAGAQFGLGRLGPTTSGVAALGGFGYDTSGSPHFGDLSATERTLAAVPEPIGLGKFLQNPHVYQKPGEFAAEQLAGSFPPRPADVQARIDAARLKVGGQDALKKAGVPFAGNSIDFRQPQLDGKPSGDKTTRQIIADTLHIDVPGSASMAQIQQAYVDQKVKAYVETSHVSEQMARYVLAQAFQKLPQVVTINKNAETALMNYWRAHPDQLKQAIDANLVEPSAEKNKILQVPQAIGVGQ